MKLSTLISPKRWIKWLAMCFLFIAPGCYTDCQAQVSVQRYKVMVGGSQVGSMQLLRIVQNNSTKLSLQCDVKKRVIWSYTVNDHQEADFQNNRLIHSSCLRVVNGKVKTNASLVYKGQFYEITNEDSVRSLVCDPITYHLLNIYFAEPVNVSQVYADNFQQFLKIEKEAAGEYKVILPDGSHSNYYYENGICTRVRSKQTLFTVEMVLIQ